MTRISVAPENPQNTPKSRLCSLGAPAHRLLLPRVSRLFSAENILSDSISEKGRVRRFRPSVRADLLKT
jgi:hypothetical protein